jgi:hypothetical protein
MSSSTLPPGMVVKRRMPTPSRAGPSTSVFLMTGNHSGQRSWSARIAKTASGEAVVVADPENEIGARSIQSRSFCSIVPMHALPSLGLADGRDHAPRLTRAIVSFGDNTSRSAACATSSNVGSGSITTGLDHTCDRGPQLSES